MCADAIYILDQVEKFIDGQIVDIDSLTKEAYRLWSQQGKIYACVYYVAWEKSRWATNCPYYAKAAVENKKEETLKQANFLSDIYNVKLLDLSFSYDIISLAQEVYNTQDPTTRFVLSDCLEEGGYPDEIVLHLKSGEHYKGCWLIDQILEKS